MAQAVTGLDTPAPPIVRKIAVADLKDALAKGIDDFRAMPSHAVFLSLIYPIVGLILIQLALGGPLCVWDGAAPARAPLRYICPYRARLRVRWIFRTREASCENSGSPGCWSCYVRQVAALLWPRMIRAPCWCSVRRR